MNKIRKIFEIGYLVIGVVCVIESYMRWNSEPKRAYMFLGLAVMAILVFFIKRHFRLKNEPQRNNSK